MPEADQTPKTLQPYIFHGVRLTASGDNAVGDCPFCGRDGKFSVKVATGQAHCWGGGGSCEVNDAGRGGVNHSSFLQLLHTKSMGAQNRRALDAFASERGLMSGDTLRAWGVCQSFSDGAWLVPGFNAEGVLCQLYKRIWDKRSERWELRPTRGIGHYLHGVPLHNADADTIYLHESWGNACAFWEVLRSVSDDGSVLAVPNCGAVGEPLKKFLPLFANKRVVLMFDSDHPKGDRGLCAGFEAVRRAASMMLAAVNPPATIDYLCWGDDGYDPDQPDGYDVRDALKAEMSPQERVVAMGKLFDRVQPIPPEWKSSPVVGVTGSSRELTPLPCVKWGTLEEYWRAAMEWRGELADALTTMLAVAISTERTGDQLFLQLIGDAGCLHGDTLIVDPVDGTTATVRDRFENGKEFHVWSKSDDGGVCIARALPPQRFSEEPMYRVTFASGRSITVTANHQFWDGGDYQSLRQAQDALRVFGAFRLPSIAESSLQAHAQDVRRCLQTTLSSRFGYPACLDSCGGRPQRRSGIDRCVLPSQVGVLGRIPRNSRRDALVDAEGRTRLGQCDDPPAMRGWLHLATTRRGTSHAYCASAGILAPCLPNTQDARRTALPTFLLDTARPHRVVAVDSTHAGDFQQARQSAWIETRRRYTPRRSAQQLPSSDLLDTIEQSHRPFPAVASSARLTPVHIISDPQFIVDEIISIEKAGASEYYDFHVPRLNNYWACGVFHHNSGKTRFCDAMITSPTCFALEHLTGFQSGAKGKEGRDYSLISRINNRTLITPEGDVLMSSPHFEEIMSQQRRIFDGVSGATYKNSDEDKRWAGLRTPWIIAGTPVLLNMDQSRLGDRFLRFVITPPCNETRRSILMRVGRAASQSVRQASNCAAGSILNPEMEAAYRRTGGYIDWMRGNTDKLFGAIEEPSIKVIERIASLAELTADLRARPDPQPRWGPEKESQATKELPTRLMAQFVRLGFCLAAVLGRAEIDTDILRRVRKVALDTGRGRTLDIVRRLLKPDKYGMLGVSSVGLGVLCGVTEERIDAYMQFLRRNHVAELFDVPNNLPRWRLTKRTTAICGEVFGGVGIGAGR